MPRFFASFSRIFFRTLFLTIALCLGLIFWYLPNLLNLDLFRPKIMGLLEKSFHCRVLVGNVQGEIFPSPGFFIGHVVFLEPQTSKVLASVNGVHLWVSKKALLTGHLRFWAIRFGRPRFIVHREQDPSGKTHWAFLALPKADPSNAKDGINQWEVRNGDLEIWDHTTKPTTKWVVNQLSGSYQSHIQKGAMVGKSSDLGSRSLIDIHYDTSGAFPIEARFSNIELRPLASLLQVSTTSLEGTSAFIVKLRLEPSLEIHATITSLLLKSLQGISIRGFASFQSDHLRMHLQTIERLPMLATLDGTFSKTLVSLQVLIRNYDADVVRRFYSQTWVNRLSSGGSVTVSAQSDAKHSWRWSAIGKDFGLEHTPFRLPEWSAQGDALAMSVDVQAQTPKGGTAAISWSHLFTESNQVLHVDISSVTLRQVLEIFDLQSKSTPTGAMNPYGYEPWLITQGSMQSLFHRNHTLEVTESDFDIQGMHLVLKGTFGINKNAVAHIEGDLQNIQVAPVVESFFKPPSPLTGTGHANFILNFPLSPQWVAHLTGPIDLQVNNGILRSFKVFYRIVSILNLSNYLRLRFPQVTAQGVTFDSITGHLMFQNGALSSDDLFLKSPGMNVGAKGVVDIPGKRTKVVLRLEMLRFLEDIFRYVPITHWIFKKPTKILFPLVVGVHGPWDDIDVD